MNHVRIQTDLMKKLDKKERVWIFDTGDGASIFISLDGVVSYIIPKDAFYIDLIKLPEIASLPPILLEGGYTDGFKTGEAKIFGKKTLIELNGQSGSVWYDSKLVKLFDKDCTFRIADKLPGKKPIKVYEDKECVGIVLPFNIGKEG